MLRQVKLLDEFLVLILKRLEELEEIYNNMPDRQKGNHRLMELFADTVKTNKELAEHLDYLLVHNYTRRTRL